MLNYWALNRMTESMALLDAIAERDPLYKPGIGNRVFQMALMGRGEEARASLAEIDPFLPDDPSVEADRAWIDFIEGDVTTGLARMEAALQKQSTDRVYKDGVNWGRYLTHQYEQVFDDKWSDFIVWALFNLGRTGRSPDQGQ